MELPDARYTFVRVTKGIATGLSIGYQTVRDKIAGGARELLELQLWETSVCVFPALAAAQITSAKHNPQQLEALLGSLRSLRHLHGYEELLAGLKSARAGALTSTGEGEELRTALRSIRTRVRR